MNLEGKEHELYKADSEKSVGCCMVQSCTYTNYTDIYAYMERVREIEK